MYPQNGPEYNGKEYVLVDFKYELLTGAGFEVDRRGVAAITSEGPAVEALWAASTRERCVLPDQDKVIGLDSAMFVGLIV